MTTRPAPHVLLIDDDAEDAFLLRRALRKHDADLAFRHVDDSEGFVRDMGKAPESGNQHPDIILLDVNMPKVNGFEVLQELRAHDDFADTRVIMWTTSNTDEDRVKARILGATDFYSKPNTNEGLTDFIKTILSSNGI